MGSLQTATLTPPRIPVSFFSCLLYLRSLFLKYSTSEVLLFNFILSEDGVFLSPGHGWFEYTEGGSEPMAIR